MRCAGNLAQLTVATTAAYSVYHYSRAGMFVGRQPLALIASAIAYFLFNTIAMSLVISLTEQKQPRRVWKECYFWSFPYYLVGAGIAEGVSMLNRVIGWQTSLLVMPAVYIIYRSYRLYLGKLETEKWSSVEIPIPPLQGTKVGNKFRRSLRIYDAAPHRSQKAREAIHAVRVDAVAAGIRK